MAGKIAKKEYLMQPVDWKMVVALIALSVIVIFVFNMMTTIRSTTLPDKCYSSSDCPNGYVCYNRISKNSCFDQKCVSYCSAQLNTTCEGEWTTVGTYPNCNCVYTCVSDMNCPAYCERQPHIMCVGQWNISGVYPDCSCQYLCDVGGPI